MQAASWFIDKLQDKNYAQNIYAALCNMRWQLQDTWTVLNDDYWSCSWRAAGGIVAELRSPDEDYMDYYCSGIRGGYDPDDELAVGRVPEGTVTDEVRVDLLKLGWVPSEWPDE